MADVQRSNPSPKLSHLLICKSSWTNDTFWWKCLEEILSKSVAVPKNWKDDATKKPNDPRNLSSQKNRQVIQKTHSSARLPKPLYLRPYSYLKAWMFVHCIHLIRLVLVSHCTLRKRTWHIHILSSPAIWPASLYWLVCRWAHALDVRRLVTLADSLLLQF